LINGGFESGDLTGWSTFTTAQGTLGTGFPQVIQFDTNNDGSTSLTAQFRVGGVQGSGFGGGGGVSQTIQLLEGNLNIAVDIAAVGGSANNGEGGIFELYFDGNIVDTFSFGGINTAITEYGTLSAVLPTIAAGQHDIAIQMRRPFEVGSTTPTQYIDNVVLTGSAVPEPTGLLLAAQAILLVAAGRKMVRKRGIVR
jgi:hypothetical protein